MEQERIDQAVQRIEAALARINAASDKMRSRSDTHSAPTDNLAMTQLTQEHDALRKQVSATLGELDQLIEEIEA
ncbi:MAG: hypothetical protein ABJ239_12550 [Erythrobacter sp.]